MSRHPKVVHGYYLAVGDDNATTRPSVVEFCEERGGHWRNQDDNSIGCDPREIGYKIYNIDILVALAEARS